MILSIATLGGWYFRLWELIQDQRWSDYTSVQRRRTFDQLKDAYLNGSLCPVSYGFLKESKGEAGWIVTDKHNLSVFEKGQCFTKGNPYSQDSQWFEIFGILGGMVFLQTHLKQWGHPPDVFKLDAK